MTRTTRGVTGATLFCAALIIALPTIHAQVKIMTVAGPQVVVFAPDGKWIAAGMADGTIKIWDAENGGLVRSIAAHEKFVRALAVSRDGGKLASGASDKAVKLWDASGTLIRSFEGYGSGVRAVAFSPDGARLVTGDESATVKGWDVATGAALFSMSYPSSSFNYISSLAFSPAGDWIATGQQGVIKLLDPMTGTLIHDRSGLLATISGLSVSPDGLFLAAAIYSGSILVADSRTGSKPRTLDHGSSAAAVAYSSDGSLLASAGGSGEVRVWETSTWKARRTGMKHKQPVFSIAFSPDGKRIASASNDGTVRLWDVGTGKEMRSFGAP